MQASIRNRENKVTITSDQRAKKSDRQSESQSPSKTKLDLRAEYNKQALLTVRRASNSSYDTNSVGSQRKITLPNYAKCLKIINLRRDSDVSGMYWYDIINMCSIELHAHWCEATHDRCLAGDFDSAWLLKPKSKTQSWDHVVADLPENLLPETELSKH
jgi:hypothetical protein